VDKFYFIYDFVITGPVMAFTKVSTAHKNAVRSIDKAFHGEDWIQPAGAHYPDHPHLGRVLEASHTRCISCGIAAPMAEEAEDPGFELISLHFSLRSLSFIVTWPLKWPPLSCYNFTMTAYYE
jgi:hypothetical protein